jgi:hypothetical protein
LLQALVRPLSVEAAPSRLGEHTSEAVFPEPTEPPPLAPSRGPPFFKSPVIRRRLGEPVQVELFDAH